MSGDGGHIEPVVSGQRFTCPHCVAITGHEWGQVYSDFPTFENELRPLAVWLEYDGEGYSAYQEMFRASRCMSCDRYTLWLGSTIIYPRALTAPLPHADMPAHISALYAEAREVFAVSRRAGGAMARAVIESLLKHVDTDAPKRATLDQRIDRVKDRSSVGLHQALTIVRHVGNVALHEGDSPDELLLELMNDDTAAVGALLFATCNDLVEEFIARPKYIALVYEQLPEGLRAKMRPKDE